MRSAGAYCSSVSTRPPSGTVTLLCTAIQDALRRWDEAPAEMAAAEPLHDRVVREAIESHGGHLFLTDADGFRAAFSTAGSAAEAAVAAQRALRADGTTGPQCGWRCTLVRRPGGTATTPGPNSTGWSG